MTVGFTAPTAAESTRSHLNTGTAAGLDTDIAAALCRASTRRGFDPFIDIDWDAAENALDPDDARWQLDSDIAPLAATEWYAQQPSSGASRWAAGSPRTSSR